MKPSSINTKLVLVPASRKGEDTIKEAKRDRIIRIIRLVLVYLFLSAAALLCIFPFYYMIAASTMSHEEVSHGQFWLSFSTLAENFVNNYTQTFSRLQFVKHVGTTLLVAITTTALQLLTTILAAFAFAKLHFKGRDVLFIAMLSAMMVPGEMLAITNYSTFSNLDLISTKQTYFQAFVTMVLPLISSVFYIFLLRQNFKQIPNELYLASKVDGKSDWQFLWKVMVPLAAPTLIAITILSFIFSWNSYVWPSLSVYESDYNVISVIIRGDALQFEGPSGALITNSAWQMTAAVLTVLPLLILFIIFRKYIMSGTGRAGIKG
jgi:multiple sugar transport system permease protein